MSQHLQIRIKNVKIIGNKECDRKNTMKHTNEKLRIPIKKK